jgi:hypothetical protein
LAVALYSIIGQLVVVPVTPGFSRVSLRYQAAFTQQQLESLRILLPVDKKARMPSLDDVLARYGSTATAAAAAPPAAAAAGTAATTTAAAAAAAVESAGLSVLQGMTVLLPSSARVSTEQIRARWFMSEDRNWVNNCNTRLGWDEKGLPQLLECMPQRGSSGRRSKHDAATCGCCPDWSKSLHLPLTKHQHRLLFSTLGKCSDATATVGLQEQHTEMVLCIKSADGSFQYVSRLPVSLQYIPGRMEKVYSVSGFEPVRRALLAGVQQPEEAYAVLRD